MRRVRVLGAAAGMAMCGAMLAGLSGCGGARASEGASNARGNRAEVSASATTTSAAVRDFQAQLREVTVTSRRMFTAGQEGYSRSDAGPSLSILVGLKDAIGTRVYRMREGSAIRSVLDGSGRELIKGSEGSLRAEGGSYGKAEFAVVADRPQTNAQLVRLSIPRMPETLRKISGEYRIELVNQDLEKTIELPAVEKPAEIASGLTLVVKMLDLPPESPASGPAQPSSSSPGPRVSVEVRSPAGTAEQQPPMVQSVELLDGVGGVVAVLTRREETTVGSVLRRRFSNVGEGGYSSSRPERASNKQPRALRVRVLTEIETVVVPFEFGPIDLMGDGAQ